MHDTLTSEHRPGSARSMDLDNPRSVAEQRKVNSLVSECRNLYQNQWFSRETKQQYERMFQELQAEGDIRKIQENVGWLRDAVREAEQSFNEFKCKLDFAVSPSNKWINRKSYDKWLGRFWNEDVVEYQRKFWLREHFDVYWTNWKKAAEERNVVIADAKRMGVDAAKVPELTVICSDDQFLDMHYQMRLGKLAEARAGLLAHERSEKRLLRVVCDMLERAALGPGRTLHASKVGIWLERIMNEEQPERFIHQILQPYMRNWQTVRVSYDLVTKRMEAQGVPRGFYPVDLDQFLLWSFDQRESYVEELGHRLTGKEMNEADSVVGLKVGIRHELDTHFWEGADRLLQKALQDYPDDPQFQSMKRYLDSHRDDLGENADTEKLTSATEMNRTLQEIISSDIPTCAHVMYQRTLAAGPAEFGALASLLYNRVWVHEHGYSTEELDIQDLHDEGHKKETQRRINEGHDLTGEKNRLDGSTRVKHAIRDECSSPQTSLTDSSTETQIIVSDKCQKNKDNWGFKYWTSLVPRDISYGQQEHIVKHVNNKVKSLAWKLHSMGFAYSSFGPPVSLN